MKDLVGHSVNCLKVKSFFICHFVPRNALIDSYLVNSDTYHCFEKWESLHYD